jgi:hypothetical protein
MFNTVAVILIALYLLDLFNITDTFKGQIGKVGKDAPGIWKKYKKPNYYGFGGWGYQYGEPYYCRHVQFPYPGTCQKKLEKN